MNTGEHLLPLTLHLPGTNGKAAGSLQNYEFRRLSFWSPFFHQKLVLRMTGAAVTPALEITVLLGCACTFSV